MISCKKIQLREDSYWGDLIKSSQTATFFQTKEWVSLWSKHFDKEVLILGIFDDNKLIGIAPLSRKNNSISLFGLDPVLGEELVSDFGDIVSKTSYEKIVWKEVLANLKSQISNIKINLNFIREDSPSFKILQALGGRIEEIDVAPYIDLPKTWDEYLLSLDRHSRHELRRKIRKMENEEAFKVCYKGDSTDIGEFFRLMVLSNEQKRNFLSPDMKKFFEDIFTVFYPLKMMQLCFLKLSGKNIASILLFIFKNEYLLYNSGFDPTYSSLSPGLLLKTYAIKHAVEEGIARFDFLRGEERYKYDLGGRERKLYRISF